MLATSSALLYCTALQTQPLSVLKESACDVACQLRCLSVIHSRKKNLLPRLTQRGSTVLKAADACQTALAS